MAKGGGRTRTPGTKKPKLTADERRARARKAQHIRLIKESFVGAGFNRISELSGTEFTFNGRMCDFDDVFILENVITLVEYTTHNEDHVSGHLLKKKIIFDYINGNPRELIDYLKSNFPAFERSVKPVYMPHHFHVRTVYASRNSLKESTKGHVPGVVFLDYPHAKYFRSLSKTIRLSAKYEFLDFLGIAPGKFSSRVLTSSSSVSSSFAGSVLPEHQSHFPPGYKVVSFYVSAGALLQRAYVLRRDSWRGGGNIYQRLIVKKKVDSIRRHLLDKSGSFVNNIIVTLPHDVRILDLNDGPIDPKSIYDVMPAKIQLTEDFNSVGIIDGQHRVFSYYEGGPNEDEIAILRQQQNLLATGIVFPEGIDEESRDRFSAKIFLQINSNQTNTKPELIQEIGVILKPFAVQSMARRVLRVLNGRGPLANEFETPFSEGAKIKTASVVNYALMPLIRPGAGESLYLRWTDPRRLDLLKGMGGAQIDPKIMEDYVEYCVVEINTFLGAVKYNLEKHRWTADKGVADRVLTTAIVNGMLHGLRRLSGANKMGDAEHYRAALAGAKDFAWSSYGSSHYNQLGQDLADHFFGIPLGDLPPEVHTI